MDEIEHVDVSNGIVDFINDGYNDDDDEESILARVLMESQKSFQFEQQHIYQSIKKTTTCIGGSSSSTKENVYNDEDQDESFSTDFFSQSHNDKNDIITSCDDDFMSRWCNDRYYNNSNSEVVTSVVQDRIHNATTSYTQSVYASMRDVVAYGEDVDANRAYQILGVDDNDDDDDEEGLSPFNFYENMDDWYEHEQLHSLQRIGSQRSRRCRRNRTRNEITNDYSSLKMPSQTSIYTYSTCAETTTATSTTSNIMYSDEYPSEEKEVVVESSPLRVEQQQLSDNNVASSSSTTTSSSLILTDDMVIQDQIRILRSIQSYRRIQYHNDTGNGVASLSTCHSPNDAIHFSYHTGTKKYPLVSSPYNTTTTNLNYPTQDEGHYTYRKNNDDENVNVMMAQCKYCTTASPIVAPSTKSIPFFFFCRKCQEESPIIVDAHDQEW